MASSSVNTPIPRWQIALAVGATSAIGLGYWYIKQRLNDHPKKSSLSEENEFDGPEDESGNSKGRRTEKTALERAKRLKVQGNKYFTQGAYDKAIECYTKAAEQCPQRHKEELATFYQNRAAAHEHLNNVDAVLEDCSKALFYNGHYVKALLRRARALEKLGRWTECLDDVSAVCLLQSFQDQSVLAMADRVLKELGRLHAIEEMENRLPFTPSKSFIKTYFSSFSEDPAYNLIMSDDLPTEENPRGFIRAKQAFLNQDFENIISACTEEIDSSESESQYKMEALLLRATFYLLRGEHFKTLEEMESIINNETADYRVRVNALVKRASLYVQLEKQENSLADFDKAAQLGPLISDVYHHRGQIMLLMDRIDDATSDFNKAVALNPDFAIAYIQKCYSDYRYGLKSGSRDRLKAAMKDFDMAIEKFPDCPECLVLYAQILTDQEQYERANGYYEKALEIDDGNVTVLVHMGLLHLQWTGDTDRALKLMKSAIKKDPLCEFAYETLATVEVQRGNLREAIKLFEKAIVLAKTQLEMTHLFSLRDAASSQLNTSERLGLVIVSDDMDLEAMGYSPDALMKKNKNK